MSALLLLGPRSLLVRLFSATLLLWSGAAALPAANYTVIPNNGSVMVAKSGAGTLWGFFASGLLYCYDGLDEQAPPMLNMYSEATLPVTLPQQGVAFSTALACTSDSGASSVVFWS
jgi:hypothetical protein